MKLFILFLTLLVLLFLLGIMPNLIKKKHTRAFMNCLYAHRGLFSPDQTIPENSLPAFKQAVLAGYGIELDIQITKDEQIVVFHDHSLSRMCGIDVPVCEMTYPELQKISLKHTQYRIPLFRDVLHLVNGQVPLLVEIKLPSLDTRTCELADSLLQNYTGDYCVESFNPMALRWYKKHRSQVVRGQLSSNLTNPVSESGFFLSFLVKYMLLNFLGRPDFISYCYKDRHNISFLLNKHLFRAPTFAWTIQSETAFQEHARHFDSIIFDSFEPVHKHIV